MLGFGSFSQQPFSTLPDAGGNTYNQNLTVSSATSAVITKINGFLKSLIISVTSSVTLIRLLTLFRTISVTSSTTASLIRSITKLISTSSTATATIAYISAFIKALTVSVSHTVSLIKGVYKTISLSVSNTVNIVKAIAKIYSVTVSSAVSLIVIRPLILLITVTSTTSVFKGLVKTLSYLSTVTSSIIKGIPLVLSVVVTSTASFVKNRLLELFVVIRWVGANLGGAIDGLGLNDAAINGIVTAQQYYVSLSIQRAKIFSVTSTATVSLIKAINKLFGIIVDNVLVVLTNQALHLIAFTIMVSETISLQKIPGKLLSVVSTTTATLATFLNKLLAVTSHVAISLIRQISITFRVISATIATLVLEFFPRLGAVIRYTFTADFKDRVTELYKERLSVIQFKDRLVDLYKQRTVLANTSNKKVQK